MSEQSRARKGAVKASQRSKFLIPRTPGGLARRSRGQPVPLAVRLWVAANASANGTRHGWEPRAISHMRTAIIGLPQVGKTSLFTMSTGTKRDARLGAAEVEVGVARVPDPRVKRLADLFQSQKVVHATVEYADVPAMSKEALRDPGYIGALRFVDAFAHVLRVFEDDTVMHQEGSLDPKRDWRNIELELILNDLEVIEKRLERLGKDIGRMKSLELERERDLLMKAQRFLETERPLRELELDEEESKRLRGFQFLSEKPMLLVCNLGESQAGKLHQVEEEYRREWLSGRVNLAVTAVCGSIEAEIAEIPAEEARPYLESYGLTESGLDRMIQATYSLLGLMSFLTASEKEVRAWTIPKHTPAVKAAGVIHSDFENKFIRAEAIHWETLIEHGGFAQARRAGELRIEGKGYIVQEGDVLVIRHG